MVVNPLYEDPLGRKGDIVPNIVSLISHATKFLPPTG